jgi:class 3 adenylate cyclase
MRTQSAGSHTTTATILFTDLVGSTLQRVALGEDGADVLRRTHDRLLTEAVAAHQGTVAKHVGDGIMAIFPGAADAVAAAVAIQQAVDSHNRRATTAPLAVRVGLSLGDVTREQGDWFGTPVIEAARLCAAADGAQILAADIVRLTARGRGGHTFRPIGPMTLKGLPEPVLACAVTWEPLAPVGFPLPPRLEARPPIAMVGREVEQAVLGRAWSEVKDGHRRVVLLAGEPGIGKTRLATEAALAAHRDGAAVLLGRCDEDVRLPYQPFVEALRHYVAHAADGVLAAHVREHKGELGRLVPELGRRVAELPAPQVAEGETERYLLFEAAAGLLSVASEEQPLVLVLDDLQWAGAPDLLLLKHVVRTAMRLRLLVIGTYRDSDLTRTHPLTALLADLRREAGVERVVLRGLDEPAVVALMTAAGHALEAPGLRLAHAIHQETEGSPLFIGEILRNLTESGAVFREGERWTYKGDVAGLGIPEGVKEAIGRRLARLPESTYKVLGLASVIGRQFDLLLLARLAEASEDVLLDGLEQAAAAALVREVGGSPGLFEFTHALIRSTLYEELGATRRARLHRTIGEALEELTAAAPDARIDELAHHWYLATRAADPAKAIAYARRAGDRALAALAFEEASAHYERALDAHEPRDRPGQALRCDLLLALAEAQRRAGDTRYAETIRSAADLARAVGDPERLARAALGNANPGGFFTGIAPAPDVIALYEEAIAALGTEETLLRARLLGQLASQLMYTPEHERRDRLSREAVDIARRVGDRMGLAQVLLTRTLAINHPTSLAERLALTRELGALARELGNQEIAFNAAFHRAGALLESGDAAGCEQAIAEVGRLAGELRQPYNTWWAAIGATMLANMRAEPDAEAKGLAALDIGTRAGIPDAGQAFGAQLVNLRIRQGRLDELEEAVRANAETNPHIPAWRSTLAFLYCEVDRLAEAREQFDLAAETGLELGKDWTWSADLVNRAQVCAALDDTAAAAILYDQVRPVAEQVAVIAGMVLCSGSFGLFAGLLAACARRWDDAERHFQAALATNARIGASNELVYARRAYAAMLLDRNAPGDAARAGQLIAEGLAEAEAFGFRRHVVLLERLRDRVVGANDLRRGEA